MIAMVDITLKDPIDNGGTNAFHAQLRGYEQPVMVRRVPLQQTSQEDYMDLVMEVLHARMLTCRERESVVCLYVLFLMCCFCVS